MSDLWSVPLRQPVIYLNVCKRTGKDPWDWSGANITLRRHQLSAVTGQSHFSTQKNTGNTVKQLKYNN